MQVEVQRADENAVAELGREELLGRRRPPVAKLDDVDDFPYMLRLCCTSPEVDDAARLG